MRTLTRRWLVLTLGAVLSCASPSAPLSTPTNGEDDTGVVLDPGISLPELPALDLGVADVPASPDSATPDTEDPEELVTVDDPGPTGDGCVPQCDGKECGADGCGGLCGFCVFGLTCSPAFKCKPNCTPACDGKQCGPDGCDGFCGSCPKNFQCGPDGKCYDVTCIPSCAGKVCGDDGCNGSCGNCKGGDLCQEGKCTPGPCSGIPKEGKCGGPTGKVAYVCKNDELFTTDCALVANKACGWSPVDGHYGCVDGVACTPKCEFKQCGDDGCGKLCGACPEGWPCQNDQCVKTAGAACGSINVVGKCEGSVIWYCSGSVLLTVDCAAVGKKCGYDVSAKKNTCK